MTVADTSVVVDYLLGSGAAPEVRRLIGSEGDLAAPDVLVFETLAVLRCAVLRGGLDADRATGAVEDLADVPIALTPSLALRGAAWELRANLTAADALFAALAAVLDEPLATKDAALAAAARRHAGVRVVHLGS